jgi:hypothetical protein
MKMIILHFHCATNTEPEQTFKTIYTTAADAKVTTISSMFFWYFRYQCGGHARGLSCVPCVTLAIGMDVIKHGTDLGTNGDNIAIFFAIRD